MSVAIAFNLKVNGNSLALAPLTRCFAADSPARGRVE